MSPCLLVNGLENFISPDDLAANIVGSVDAGFSALRDALGVAHSPVLESMKPEPYMNQAIWPNPQVKIACDPNFDYTNIAIWFEQPGAYGTSDTDAMRDQWTSQLAITQAGDSFGMRVDAYAISLFTSFARDIAQRQAKEQAEDAPILDADDLVLNPASFTYSDYYKRLTTRIDGYVKGQITGENTNFWLIMRDNFTIGASSYWTKNYSRNLNMVKCTGTSLFNYSGSVDTVVLDILMFVAEPFLDVFGAGGVDIDEMMEGQTQSLRGPGCEVAKAFPNSVLIPDLPFKMLFDYKRVAVTQAGITAGGELWLEVRDPAANINGPSVVWATPGVAPSADFSIIVRDMRPPLTVVWEAPNGIIDTQVTSHATIRWNVNVTSPTTQYSRLVKVSVTDADGETRTHQKYVTIKSAVLKDDLDPCVIYCAPADDAM